MDAIATSPGHYEATSPPISVLIVKPEDKPNPKIGVSAIAFNFDSSFVATRNENMPNSLWVWNATSFSLHSILNQLEPIRVMQWHPQRNLLAFCTGSPKVYFWTLDGAYVIHVPHRMHLIIFSLHC